ncbi:type III secretion system needle filament subunit SctF [Chitinimonas sp. BJB300]|uniref:type III secretion system needle filament subunit SctF n=1 Tax=Chitinimonas sp. BJB300 TaxID=1559339 RepID=UPI000C1159A6|nr:type III secretion system needle filament subunit SctF [Chitinimonas sp. BJB300]PHV11495.1 EscF/YscF/HrpA family type III secretion system needle major subunit [Chitinimonas sp. BJB300]TSJ88509.1 EscF/YscF/HrpA family type III secretion system needle major subunit [Chitinimonas sp. BJB300]
MNIENIVAQMGNQISRTASDADIIVKGDVVNSPEGMLKAQYAMQQYSVAVGYSSAVMKSLKDMMMGIISKM